MDCYDHLSCLRSSGAATQQVSKRLQSELMSLMMSGDKGISAFPDGDNLLSWVGTVEGPKDSVYEGLKFKLRLEFPAGYPYQSPTVRFSTPCFHPNVDTHGNICLDILKEKWSALYEVNIESGKNTPSYDVFSKRSDCLSLFRDSQSDKRNISE